jgi:hypothetical protein
MHCSQSARTVAGLRVARGPGSRGARITRVPAWVGAMLVAGVVVAGCGSSGGGPHGPVAAPSASQLAPPRVTCGTSRTAANVPVIVEVEKGTISCPQAMRIQSGYTGLVRSGKVGGNGGGAPVRVDGWTCQGTDTTTTVQTGEASECHKGTTEIVAVLKLQSTGQGS